MTELQTVLDAFRDATGCDAALWMRDVADAPPRRSVATPADAPTDWTPPLDSGAPRTVDSPRGSVMIAHLGGPRRAWLVVGPCPDPTIPLDSYRRFLLPVVSQYLQSALEVEHAAAELAERYEEINLLYTISEILGRTVSLEEAAATILKEVSETVGARCAAILVHDRVTDTLQVVSALGIDPGLLPPIAIDDRTSVSAQVFREQRATISEDGVMPCEAEVAYRSGATLSVPIMWTAPTGGAEPLGVVNLSKRRSGQPFSAGDQKLITAIATQIGTAIQNTRLVRASLSQQRLVREMELAHDLQMRLLPRTELAAPHAEVAARVAPAESVGGDFYNLFRLGEGRTGVMIGDVSSHGYRAALIMALAMSASAIHAQDSSDPEDVLAALLQSLRDELRSTEMFIAAFYCVIDPAHRQLRFANAGHPYAYLISPDGTPRRLGATGPPLGMIETAPSATSEHWSPGEDLLVLFTDGISDARDRFDARLGEQRVLDVIVEHRRERPAAIVSEVFDLLADHTEHAAQRDDLTLVVVRS